MFLNLFKLLFFQELAGDVVEESISDPRIQHQTVEDGPCKLSYQLVESGTKCGKSKLADSEGYTYNVQIHRQTRQTIIRGKRAFFNILIHPVVATRPNDRVINHLSNTFQTPSFTNGRPISIPNIRSTHEKRRRLRVRFFFKKIKKIKFESNEFLFIF